MKAELEQIWNDGFVPFGTPLARKDSTREGKKTKRTKPRLDDVNFDKSVSATHTMAECDGVVRCA